MFCNVKLLGTDRLYPKVIKRRGRRLVKVLYTIIRDAWENLEVPGDWKDAQLDIIFNRWDCGNYHGISLLFIPGNVFVCILLNRLSTLAEDFLPEVQCGFCINRETTDMIFSLWQIQEKCIESNMLLYVIFVGFTKSFNTMNREALWNIIQKLGWLNHFIKLVSALYTRMKASINFRGKFLEPFEVGNRVKQSSLLTSTLLILFSVALSDAFIDSIQEVWIQSRLGSNLFNAFQFKSARKTRNTT